MSGKIPWGRMCSEVTRFFQEDKFGSLRTQRSPEREGVEESTRKRPVSGLIYVTGKGAHLHLEFRVQCREVAVWAHRPVVFQHVPALGMLRVVHPL